MAAELWARVALAVVLLLGLLDIWCSSALGCRPAVAGGTKLRPAWVCLAASCALVGSVMGVVQAAAGASAAVERARDVATLAASNACWGIAAALLRTSTWRASSACGRSLGCIGGCIPTGVVGVAVLVFLGASAAFGVAWPHDEPHAPAPARAAARDAGLLAGPLALLMGKLTCPLRPSPPPYLKVAWGGRGAALRLLRRVGGQPLGPRHHLAALRRRAGARRWLDRGAQPSCRCRCVAAQPGHADRQRGAAGRRSACGLAWAATLDAITPGGVARRGTCVPVGQQRLQRAGRRAASRRRGGISGGRVAVSAASRAAQHVH